MTGVCVRFLTSRSWAAVGLVSGFLSKALFRKSLKSLDLKHTKPLNIRPREGCNLLLCNGEKTTIDSQSYSRNVKEILLCFSTFFILVRMFGHITIYKVTNLKVHSKEKKNPFSRTTTVGEMDRLDYKGVFMHLWHHKDNPAYWNSTGWEGGGLGWALHASESKPSAGVHISLYFWWKPTVFRTCWMLFSFHLACNVW